MSNSWRDGWSTPFWQPSTRRRLPMHDHTATAKAAARHLGHMSSVKASIPASISPSSPRNISAGPPVSPSSVARPNTAAAHLSHSSPSVPANTLPPSMSLIQSQSQQNIPDSVSGANGESTARKKWSFSSLSAVAPLTSGAPSSQSSPPVERGSSTPIQALPVSALTPGKLLRLSSDISENSEQNSCLANASVQTAGMLPQSPAPSSCVQQQLEITTTLVEAIGEEKGNAKEGRTQTDAAIGVARSKEQGQISTKTGAQPSGPDKTHSGRSLGKRDDVIVYRRDLRRRLTMNALGVTTKRRQTLSDYTNACGRRYIAVLVASCWLFVTGAVFKLCGDWLSPLCIQSNLVDCGCPSFSWMGFSTAIRRGTYYIYPCLMFVIINHAILRDNDLLRIKYGRNGDNGRDYRRDIVYPVSTFLSCVFLTTVVITAVPEHPFVCLIPCSFCLLVQSYAHGRLDGIRATIPTFAVTFFMQGWNVMSLWVLTAITKGLGWSVLFYSSSAFAAGFMLFNKLLFMRLHILCQTPISEVAVFAIGSFCAFWMDSYIEGILLYYVDEGIGPVIMVSMTTAMVDLVDKCQLFPRLATALRKIAEEEEQLEQHHAAEAKREEENAHRLVQDAYSPNAVSGLPMRRCDDHSTESQLLGAQESDCSQSDVSAFHITAAAANSMPPPTGAPISYGEIPGISEAAGLHKVKPYAPNRTITVAKRTWTTKTSSPRPIAATVDNSAGRLQSALKSRGKTLGDTVVTEAAASGFKVENSLDYDEFVKYRNVGKAWNWVTFGHEFNIAICAVVLQILRFSPTGLSAEGDCTGNTVVRVLDFPATVSSYSVFLIPAFTRLFMGYFIPFVVFKRKWLGTSLQMANPAPQIPMLYLIVIYIASSHTAFHQFEIIARFACIGKTENPCIPLAEVPKL